jgi:hypothetical protein
MTPLLRAASERWSQREEFPQRAAALAQHCAVPADHPGHLPSELGAPVPVATFARSAAASTLAHPFFMRRQ